MLEQKIVKKHFQNVFGQKDLFGQFFFFGQRHVDNMLTNVQRKSIGHLSKSICVKMLELNARRGGKYLKVAIPWSSPSGHPYHVTPPRSRRNCRTCCMLPVTDASGAAHVPPGWAADAPEDRYWTCHWPKNFECQSHPHWRWVTETWM